MITGQPDHLNTGQIDAILISYVLVRYLKELTNEMFLVFNPPLYFLIQYFHFRSSRSKFLQEQQHSQPSQSQSRDQALTDLGAEPSTNGGGLFDDLGELNQTDNRHDKMLSQR